MATLQLNVDGWFGFFQQWMTGHQQPAMHPPHQDAYLGSVLLVEDGNSTSDWNFT